MRIAGLKRLKSDNIDDKSVDAEISTESVNGPTKSEEKTLTGKLVRGETMGAIAENQEPRELTYSIELDSSGNKIVTAYILSSLCKDYTKFIKLITTLSSEDVLHLHVATLICTSLCELKHCKASITIYVPVISSINVLASCMYADKIYVGKGSKLILSGYKNILWGTDIDIQDSKDVETYDINFTYAIVLYAGILTEDDLRMLCLKNRTISMFGKELQDKLDAGLEKIKATPDLDSKLIGIAENLKL